MRSLVVPLLVALAPSGPARSTLVPGTPVDPGDLRSEPVADPAELASPHVLWRDLDGDGLEDLYASAPGQADRLLRNAGDGTFLEVTLEAGLAGNASALALASDVDRDGWTDLLLVTRSGALRLHHGLGNGVFHETTIDVGLADAAGVTGARWLDYDADGWLDLWVEREGGAPALLRNAAGLFTPVELGFGPPSVTPPSELVAGTRVAQAVQDRANPEGALEASSVPTLGRLFPLTMATVTNLDADRVDGLDASAFRLQSAPITAADLAPNSVGSSEVVDGSLRAADLGTDSVSSSELAAGSVGASELGFASVTSPAVKDDSLTSADIATNAIGNAELAPSSVTGTEVAADSLTAADIASGAIGGAELASNAVTGSKVVDGSLTAVDLATNAVGSSELAPNSVFSVDVIDGQLLDVDVAASAGIAGTKIDPDFGSQNVTTTGFVGIGSTTPDQPLVVGSNLARGWLIPAATIGGPADLGGALTIGQGSSGLYSDIRTDTVVGGLRIQSSTSGGEGTGSMELLARGGIEVDGALSDPNSAVFFNDNLDVSGNLFDSSGALTVGDALEVWGSLAVAGTISNSTGDVVIADNVTGADFYASISNGVINAGGGVMSSSANVIADALPAITVATGDEDLVIGDDLEVVGQGYKPGGGFWAAISDARLKQDVQPYREGLAEVLRIEPVRFRYTEELGLQDDRTFVGVLAQDIQEIAPDMVEERYLFREEHERADGTLEVVDPGERYLTYDGSALPYMLVNAIQELSASHERLAAENRALRARVEALEAR